MIERWEFENMMGHAKQRGDVDLMKKLMELYQTGAVNPTPTPAPFTDLQKLSLDGKSVTINVQIMVENLLGGHNENRDVQVRLEKYGRTMHTMMNDDQLAFVVVNICNLQTKEIITLREQYHKFPSSEFLTKLELLRVGDNGTGK